MSAFLCSEKHIKQLAIYAAQRGTHGARVDPRYLKKLPQALKEEEGANLATAYATVLLWENQRSLAARYPDDEKGPDGSIKVSEREYSNHEAIPTVAIMKMANCYGYQACETDDYADTAAAEIIRAIKEHAISELPGYEDAPWGEYEAPKRKRAA